MKAHTALVIQATFGFESFEQFTNLVRVPVIAYSTALGENEGEACPPFHLQRSEVFRSQDDALTAGETWKAAMGREGLYGH